MTKRKANRTEGFAVGQCSLCEEMRLTVGQQWHGGVRWCGDCIKESFGWHQMNADQRGKVEAAFNTFSQDPTVQKKLRAFANVTSEMRKDAAIGESRRRMMQAEHEEAMRQ